MSISTGQKIIINAAADTEAKSEARITPQMIQYLSVLQMNAAVFDAYISKSIEENPMLELPDDGFEKLSISYSGMGSDELVNKAADNAPAYDESLEFELKSQLEAARKHTELPEMVYRLCLIYIDNLDDDGYLSEELIDLAISADEVGRDAALWALSILQSMYPAGVGARNDEECIRIQRERGERIQTRPGRSYSDHRSAPLVYPDIYILGSADDSEESLSVRIDPRNEPKVGISRQYMQMMKEAADDDTLRYLKAKKQQAEWIIGCIEQRYLTLSAIAEAIAVLQKDFLTDENALINMITLGDVAKIAGISESTVSRAVRDKYVSTPRGTYPLAFFIPRARSSHAGTMSYADRCRMLLRHLIYAEDRAHPLSDQRIAEEMLKSGYSISRRAVTKYRLEMGIPSSRYRRNK